jgi:hypothetical protein
MALKQHLTKLQLPILLGGFAYKAGGALSQPIIEPGEQYKVSIVTDVPYAPANNVIVTVFVDIGPK